MYITVKTIKRSLGFKGIEILDIAISFPIIVLFILLFCLTSLKIPSLTFLMLGAFCLLPINISKKNRMYKIIGLIFSFIFRTKYFVYINDKEEYINEENKS
ncbi:MAG: hypothetical protein IJ565_02585 [Bacilli bacterium]|nr:hypothetical protein [Bacilli bacterium]